MAAEARHPAAVQAPLAIAAVGSVARALVGAGALSELAEHALGGMCQALGLRVAALYLPDADDVPLLRRFAVAGADIESVGLLDELRFEHEAWRLASAGGRALVFHEPATWLVANPFDPPASAWFVLPLDAGDDILGVVAAAQRRPLALDETSAVVLAILGDLLGAGIAAARLRQRITRTEVERERLRLAADIHDGLAQDLALAKRDIALLDSEPPAGLAMESRARRREAVGAAHRIVRARLEDLSTPIPLGGLGEAVAIACQRARERGLPVELRAAAVEPAAPEVTATRRSRRRKPPSASSRCWPMRSARGTAHCGIRASRSARAPPTSPARPRTTARGTRAFAGARWSRSAPTCSPVTRPASASPTWPAGTTRSTTPTAARCAARGSRTRRSPARRRAARCPARGPAARTR